MQLWAIKPLHVHSETNENYCISMENLEILFEKSDFQNIHILILQK